MMEDIRKRYPNIIKSSKDGSYDIHLNKGSTVHVEKSDIKYNFSKNFRDRSDYIQKVRQERFLINKVCHQLSAF